MKRAGVVHITTLALVFCKSIIRYNKYYIDMEENVWLVDILEIAPNLG